MDLETAAATAETLRAAMVDEMVQQGCLRSDRWKDAFAAVPRHLFVPQIYAGPGHDGAYRLLRGDDPAQAEEWLTLAYNDDALPVQLDDGGVWVSSSSQPSLMALMLEALDITGTERVLEVGTGTGYNAALLCEAMRDRQLVSIDIDAGLMETAGEKLAELGHCPTLVVGDGADGYLDGGPYDRIIGTCSMPVVPAAWIEQSNEGGLILVNLHRDLRGGVMVLLKISGDEASGHFLPFCAGFIPTRTQTHAEAVNLLKAALDQVGTTRSTTVGGEVLDDLDFMLLGALRVPAIRLEVTPKGGTPQCWLLGRDGSWAYQTTGRTGKVCTQGGPTFLWDLLEEVHADWVTLGRPAREEFGLTVSTRGDSVLWHGTLRERNWKL